MGHLVGGGGAGPFFRLVGVGFPIGGVFFFFFFLDVPLGTGTNLIGPLVVIDGGGNNDSRTAIKASSCRSSNSEHRSIAATASTRLDICILVVAWVGSRYEYLVHIYILVPQRVCQQVNPQFHRARSIICTWYQYRINQVWEVSITSATSQRLRHPTYKKVHEV